MFRDTGKREAVKEEAKLREETGDKKARADEVKVQEASNGGESSPSDDEFQSAEEEDRAPGPEALTVEDSKDMNPPDLTGGKWLNGGGRTKKRITKKRRTKKRRTKKRRTKKRRTKKRRTN